MPLSQQQPCPWAKGDDYLHYHDTEWGVPSHDRIRLFEKLCLEGQQAGLSWINVLRTRERYRGCFHQIVPEKNARMSGDESEPLLTGEGLIRNRLKLYGIRKNALALLALEAQRVKFAELLWSLVGGKTMVNRLVS